jgi:hypothetical protein
VRGEILRLGESVHLDGLRVTEEDGGYAAAAIAAGRGCESVEGKERAFRGSASVRN